MALLTNVKAGDVKWAMNDIPPTYGRIGLPVPETISRWTYKERFCTVGSKRFKTASDKHLDEHIQRAVAFLLEPYHSFSDDFQCLTKRVTAPCRKPKGYEIRKEDMQEEFMGIRRNMMNKLYQVPTLSGSTAWVFENHATNASQFIDWLEIMVDWHYNMHAMGIAPVIASHVFMLKWFDTLLHSKPKGLLLLQASLAKANSTLHWRRAMAHFLMQNTNAVQVTSEPAHFVALLIASVCQLHKKNTCASMPLTQALDVHDLIDWAVDQSKNPAPRNPTPAVRPRDSAKKFPKGAQYHIPPFVRKGGSAKGRASAPKGRTRSSNF